MVPGTCGVYFSEKRSRAPEDAAFLSRSWDCYFLNMGVRSLSMTASKA